MIIGPTFISSPFGEGPMEVKNVDGEIRRESLPGLAIGDGESVLSACARWASKLEFIEKGPLGAHFSWYTHRNPAGCWICDLCTLVSVSMSSVRRLESQLKERECWLDSIQQKEPEPLNDEVPFKDLEKTSD